MRFDQDVAAHLQYKTARGSERILAFNFTANLLRYDLFKIDFCIRSLQRAVLYRSLPPPPVRSRYCSEWHALGCA